MTTALGALGSRLSTFVRQTLLSVVVPGLVLLFELWVVTGQQEPEDLDVAHPLVVALVVYLGYTVGYAARYIAFRIADVLAMAMLLFPNRSPRLTREPRPALPYGQTMWGRAFYRRRAFERNMALLRTTYGKAKVDEALALHPLEALRHDQVVDGPALREVFHYCKTYLCLRAPSLSTETREVELNTHLGAVLPVLGLVPVAIAEYDLGPQEQVVAALLAGLIALVLVGRANYLRHTEVFDVVRNLLFARWLDLEVPPPRATVRVSGADSPEDPHSSKE
jgi:hypothetical protein